MATPTSSVKAAERRSMVVADGRTERFEGFDLLALPLSSGHLLAVRRRATSSIGPPFTSVWLRDGAGRWTIHVDVVPSRSCPRYFGPALHDVRVGTIDLVWKSGYELWLYVRPARLHLALRLAASVATRGVTAAARLLPTPLWRADSALTALGRAAGHALHAGPLTLRGRAPAGHTFRLRPRAVWRVEAAAVMLDSRDLGEVVGLTEHVALGDLVIPRTALFAVGSSEFSLP